MFALPGAKRPPLNISHFYTNGAKRLLAFYYSRFVLPERSLVYIYKTWGNVVPVNSHIDAKSIDKKEK